MKGFVATRARKADGRYRHEPAGRRRAQDRGHDRHEHGVLDRQNRETPGHVGDAKPGRPMRRAGGAVQERDLNERHAGVAHGDQRRIDRREHDQCATKRYRRCADQYPIGVCRAIAIPIFEVVPHPPLQQQQ